MRWLTICAAGLLCLGGCATRKSSLLFERQARGPIDEEPLVAQPVRWTLTPDDQTKTQGGVEVDVKHATPDYLKTFFSNRAFFGPYAGANPYFPEHMIFYVKIANRSEQKIRINPPEFIVVDDLGDQYSTVGVDYITAFAEYRQPLSTTTRQVLEDARPGYFGLSLPVGKLIQLKPQGRFALLQQSSLQPGYLYPGVAYDGLIAFWSPTPKARKLRLLITNVKTGFDAADEPRSALEFPFEFDAANPGQAAASR